MSRKPLFFVATALFATAATVALAQAGSGIRYRVTTSMEMPGMNMTMPGGTQEVCGARGAPSQSMVPVQDNCTISNYQASGNKTSFDFRCTGRDASQGRGEFEMLGGNSYRGKMDVTAEGQRMIMRFEGKEIGSCDYATESPEAQGRAMMAQSCAQLLQQPPEVIWAGHASFIGGSAICAADRAKFCAKMTTLGNSRELLRKAEQQDASMRGQNQGGLLWQAFQGCGSSRDAVLAKHCPAALSARDFSFVADMCPTLIPRACEAADPLRAGEGEFIARHCQVRAEALARQHCVSRGFTADRLNPYNGFCAAFRKQRMMDGRALPAGVDSTDPSSSGDDAPAAGRTPAQPAPKKSWRDRLRDAVGG